MNAIEEVFGKEFMAHKRVVTCQWHFKSCTRRQLPGIDKDEQKSFEGLIAKLCECYTKGEYDRISSALEDFVTAMIFCIGGSGGKHKVPYISSI